MPRKSTVNRRLDKHQPLKGSKPIQTKPMPTDKAVKYRILQGDSTQTKMAVQHFIEMREEEARKMPALDLGFPALIQPKTFTSSPDKHVIPVSRASSPTVSPLLGAQSTEREFSPSDFLIKDVDVLCTEKVETCYFNEFAHDRFNFEEMQTVLTFGDGAGSITRKTKPLLEKD